MVDKSNKPNITYDQLSILISQDGFSFYLKHKFSEKSLVLDTQAENDILSPNALENFKNSLEYFQTVYKFKSILLVYADQNYTFVPNEFYKESHKADYLKYNVQLFETDHLASDSVKDIRAVQIFIPLMSFHNVVLDRVKEFEYIHFTNILVKKFKASAYQHKQIVNVVVRNNQLDIVAFKDEKFILCNTYIFQTDLDLVYYILFSVEELQFNPLEVLLKVTHNQEKVLWLKILEKYVINISCSKVDYLTFL